MLAESPGSESDNNKCEIEIQSKSLPMSPYCPLQRDGNMKCLLRFITVSSLFPFLNALTQVEQVASETANTVEMTVIKVTLVLRKETLLHRLFQTFASELFKLT